MLDSNERNWFTYNLAVIKLEPRRDLYEKVHVPDLRLDLRRRDRLAEDNIKPGTKWDDVPMNWTCPECGARKDDFEMVEI